MKKILGILYWLWSLTWGCLLTIPGLLITGFCIVFLKGKPHKNGFTYIVEIGGNWGGMEIGCVGLCGKYYNTKFYEQIRRHEFGHSIQQLIFGPFQLFVVAIPSMIRCFTIKDSSTYDLAWFEGTATKWGTKWIERIEQNVN